MCHSITLNSKLSMYISGVYLVGPPGVFSEDPEKCDRVSKALDAGICFKNCYRFISYTASFGGRKNSGYGRESGADAISDMQIKKTIWTSNSRVTEDPFKIR